MDRAITVLSEDQIKHMRDRFLHWPVPEGLNPDGGFRNYDPVINKGSEHEHRLQDTGTNLLDATQAEAMVRYLVEGLPADEVEG